MMSTSSPSPAQDVVAALTALADKSGDQEALLETAVDALDALAFADDDDVISFLATLDRRPALLQQLLGIDPEDFDPLMVRIEALYDKHCIDWTFDSLMMLDDHLASHPSEQELLVFAGLRRVAAIAGSAVPRVEVLIHFLDPRPMIGAVLWDRAYFDSPSFSAIAIAVHCGGTSCRLIDESPPASWHPGPLFLYHPSRFEQSRRYSKHVLALAARLATEARDTMMLSELQVLMDHLVTEMNARAGEVPLRARLDGHTDSMLLVHAEEAFFTTLLMWAQTGRQIFDVPPAMVALLRHTDVGDVPVPSLASPYAAYYMHFGPQSDLLFENGWAVDGCYVIHDPQSRLLRFVFTAAPDAPARILDWAITPEPFYEITFEADAFAADVATAIDFSLSDRHKELADVEAGRGEFSLAHRAAREAGDEIADRVVDVSPERAARQAAMEARREPIMREALTLAINMMAYLMAYPDDVETRFPARAPAALVAKATQGNDKARHRATSKLEALGFRKVHFAGNHLLSQGGALPTGEHREVRAHWRRGHWRRTPCGEGRMQRRLTLIMPTLVRRDRAVDEPPPAHLYMVD